MNRMLALLYISGEGMKTEEVLKPLSIFVATNNGACTMLRTWHLKLNIKTTYTYIYIYIHIKKGTKKTKKNKNLKDKGEEKWKMVLFGQAS